LVQRFGLLPYLRFREPSWLLLRSPWGIDPLSWFPVKSLKKPNVVDVNQHDAQVKIKQYFWKLATYRTVNEGNCERVSGTEPVKLLCDRFLQHIYGPLYVWHVISYRDPLRDWNRSRTQDIQILDGLEICKRRWYIAIQTAEGYVSEKYPTIRFNHSIFQT
jgi:hypothetical protein